MEVTAHTMLLLTRLWGLAWAYRDGFVSPKELSEEQKERKVVHLPTLFEFASFTHFSTGCMVGPYLEYYEYINWIELSGPYKNMPRGNLQNLVPALTRMG